MSDSDYRHVLNELESLLRDTAETLERFVETGMDQELPEDYQKLLAIQAEALHEQQVYLNALRQEPEYRH
ncbi:hypothetical protein [Halochromatium roseum]|uniref:hypothetical protein n=1 Tax=Halochromatium roseum TaxID=391920 RepID=UPI00191154F2|nr:hypothetical protein [Halochromatium roseum]